MISYRNIILFFFLATTILLGALLTNKELVPFLAQKYAGEYGVKYSKVQGTLLFGIKAQDLSYKDFLSAKSISIRYDFFSLLSFSPKITKITSDSLYLNIDKVPSTDSNESSGLDTVFRINKLLLKNVQIEYKKELYGFEVNASKIHFDETLSIKKIALRFESSHVKLDLEGSIDENTLSAKLQTLKFKETRELELQDILMRLSYSLKAQKLKGDFTYNLSYDKFALQAKQDVELYLDGNFSSHINIKVVDTPFALPFENIRAKAHGNAQNIAMGIDANKLHYKLKSADYNNFFIQGEAKDLELSFIKELPKLLREDSLSFTNTADLRLSPLRLNIKLKADSRYYAIGANAEFKDGNVSALYEISPKRDTFAYKEFSLEKFSPLSGSYVTNGVYEKLEIKANLLRLKLLKKDAKITGEGMLASNRFTLATELQSEYPLELNIATKITSLKKTLKEFEMSDTNLSDFSDVSIDINSTLVLSEPFLVKSSIFIPKIAYKADEQTTHIVSDIRAKTNFSDNTLSLESYRLKYKSHSIHSNKISKISLRNNSDIFFKELWIFDNLLLSGEYKSKVKSGEFSLKSNNFHYKGKDADVNVKIDLNASFDLNTTTLQGSISLLDGNISYVPSSDYTINDADIIIIQDIKKRKDSDILMNVKINSVKDILYINKNANIYFRPDVTLLKTPSKGTHIKGIVSITKGEINLSGKQFIFDKSELYFNGNIPINPRLDLNLHYYTLEYIDILIAITHTLEEPVFIFSSNPALSQNDIMSYILFGESANSMFNSSGNSSKTSLLLGIGIKELFNTNSSIQLDTLNILTSDEGNIGYEVGSRIRKDMRLIYKNDTASSVILQYNLSKSTRLDVDVRETGQGVSFIYLRDFKDFR